MSYCSRLQGWSQQPGDGEAWAPPALQHRRDASVSKAHEGPQTNEAQCLMERVDDVLVLPLELELGLLGGARLTSLPSHARLRSS